MMQRTVPPAAVADLPVTELISMPRHRAQEFRRFLDTVENV